MLSSSCNALMALVLAAQAGAAAVCAEESCQSASSLLQRERHRNRLAPLDIQAMAVGDVSKIQPLGSDVGKIPLKTVSRMVLPEPYPCELMWPHEHRFTYYGSVNGTISLCGHKELSVDDSWDGLHPLQLSTTVRWERSLRLLGPIGSLPCCPTPPYCMAPTCSAAQLSSAPPGASLVCTKAPALALYGYLTRDDVWPAYFARGGASDLDVFKHWDVLGRLFGCYDNSTGQCQSTASFDLSIDLGADWGSYTEKFFTRKFAKDSIMMDCVPKNLEAFHMRLGNASYVNRWYSGGHVVPTASNPQFEFHSFALSNVTAGTFDICDPTKTWGIKGLNGETVPPCPVPIATVDSIVPGMLSPSFQSKFAQAQSLYVKLDLDGMDQMAIDGMSSLLAEVRGTHENGSPRYLVNFMMLEYCPTCLIETRQEKGFTKYDLGTNVQLLESLGFEVFLVGPHYIPLSHGSWSEIYDTLFSTPQKCPPTASFATFSEVACTVPGCPVENCMAAADLFAMRSTHPRATEVKLALGSCQESPEFFSQDPQYAGA